MRLENKNAIITGGGSGIGRAIAIGYAKEGASVVIADVDLPSAEETTATIRRMGGKALAVKVDVTRRQQVEAMLETSVRELNRIHILLCSAGISSTFNSLYLPTEEWNRVLAVNLKGLFLCGQVIAKHMAALGGGSIINISSNCAEIAQADAPHYIASKGGARTLTKAMALDLVGYGIRVNALSPGFTDTGLSDRFKETEEGRVFLSRLLDRIPMHRSGEPEEMVGAAVFLASDQSSYVTGISLPVDGGYLAK